MQQGTVKWFNAVKGYGFIEPSDGSQDLFVHHSNILGDRPLEMGERVQFEVEQTPKGLKALQVSVIEGATE